MNYITVDDIIASYTAKQLTRLLKDECSPLLEWESKSYLAKRFLLLMEFYSGQYFKNIPILLYQIHEIKLAWCAEIIIKKHGIIHK